jgi:hypothetical protein
MEQQQQQQQQQEMSDEQLSRLTLIAEKISAALIHRDENNNLYYIENYDSIVELPITKIGNLPVEVILKINESSIKLNVFRRFAKDRPDSKIKELYTTRTFSRVQFELNAILVDALTFLKNTISRMYLNKFEGMLTFDDYQFNGTLVTDGLKYDHDSVFANGFFPSEHSNCEFTYNFCCVCLDLTTSKTPCNHFLCIDCEEKLQFDEEVEVEMEEDDDSDDENENGKKFLYYRKCPMCRLWLGHL